LPFRRFGLFVGLVRLRRVFWATVLAPWLSACKFCEGFRVYASVFLCCCKKERFQWRHVWLQNSVSALNPDVPSSSSLCRMWVVSVLVFVFLCVSWADYDGSYSYRHCYEEEC
jgi:hypothetical protein